MFRRLINRLTSRSKAGKPAEPVLRIIARADHSISRRDISDNALKVLYRLHKAGYQAFLVGGGIRDLLLGLHPKDFDVATNAHPEQVKALFGNARIIGRRFRLVHVQYGRDIIEVATFRARHDGDAHPEAQQSETGLILRDNIYGTIEDDVMRRDFTANALYYNIADFSLQDHVNAMADIDARTLRMIGDPEQRYREDPVRMLRAVRFAVKLDFGIEEATEAPLYELGYLLDDISSARLFDEVLKLFSGGNVQGSLELLQHYGLFEHLFPYSDLQASEVAQELVRRAAISTDERLQAGKSINPAFLFAVLLWPSVERLYAQYLQEGMPPVPALQRAGQDAITEQNHHTFIPRFAANTLREIWDLQPRLTGVRGRRAEQLLVQSKFRAAYDFLCLREDAGDTTTLGMGDWWTRYQAVDSDGRDRLLHELESGRRQAREAVAEDGGDGSKPKGRRRGGRYRGRKPNSTH